MELKVFALMQIKDMSSSVWFISIRKFVLLALTSAKSQLLLGSYLYLKLFPNPNLLLS